MIVAQLCEYTKPHLIVHLNGWILCSVSYNLKDIVLGETGAWLTYLHPSWSLPYRATDLEGCWESFTCTLSGVYPGTRKLRERTDSFQGPRVKNLDWDKNQVSWFSISRLFLHRTLRQVPCIITAWALAGVAQWIEHRLWNKGLPFRFPVRAHAWVAGQVPSTGRWRSNTHTDISLPLFLLLFPSV